MERFLAALAHNPKYRRIAIVLRIPCCLRPEDGVLAPDAFELVEPGEDLALNRSRLLDVRNQLPRKLSAMDIARIIRFLGIVPISIVVDLADLVSAVDDRQTRLREHIGVEHEVLAHGNLHSLGIALEARGLIKRDATKPRALELFNEDGSSVSLAEVKESPDRGTVTLPLVGRVAAGMPILAEQNVEDTFTLPTEIATDASSFVLEVHGDSMINAGIFNGDYLVVREQKNAMNGEIVVAMIDNEATVKTFYKERGRVRLQPENDAMEPIYAENPQILGKVVALMRRF